MKQIFALLAALFLSISFAFAAVNVNTATEAELQTLQGIGPAKAKAIIDYRTKNGPFKSFDDLDKVSGIGQGTIKTLKSDVTFTGATTVAASKTDKGAKAEKTDKKADKTADKKAEKSADKKADKKADTADKKAEKSADKKADKKADKSADKKAAPAADKKDAPAKKDDPAKK